MQKLGLASGAIPFIAHWPKGIGKQDKWVHDPAHLMDVMPTLIDITGAKYPATLNGNSITPAGIKGDTHTTKRTVSNIEQGMSNFKVLCHPPSSFSSGILGRPANFLSHDYVNSN